MQSLKPSSDDWRDGSCICLCLSVIKFLPESLQLCMAIGSHERETASTALPKANIQRHVIGWKDQPLLRQTQSINKWWSRFIDNITIKLIAHHILNNICVFTQGRRFFFLKSTEIRLLDKLYVHTICPPLMAGRQLPPYTEKKPKLTTIVL